MSSLHVREAGKQTHWQGTNSSVRLAMIEISRAFAVVVTENGIESAFQHVDRGSLTLFNVYLIFHDGLILLSMTSPDRPPLRTSVNW